MHYLKMAVTAPVILPILPLAISEEITWEEYEHNPIFGEWIDGPKAYYPSVLYDPGEFSGHGAAARYRMWYGTSGGQTGLAVSDDGIVWTDLGVVMGDGYHATVEYYSEGFAGANSGETMYYRMWYWDLSSGVPGSIYGVEAIGYAESSDGESCVSWHNRQPLQNGTVPIVTGTWPDWNRGSYGPCDVLYNPDATNTGSDPFDYSFVMYYDGTTGGDEAIGLGYSEEGIVWNGYDEDNDGKADPVLNGTYNVGDWDYNYVSRATVIKNDENGYEMWYSAGLDKMNEGIGYAVSSDGIHWTRDENNPIFYRGDGYPWRETRTYCPMVIKDGDSYKMWFVGKGDGDYSVGYTARYLPEPEPAVLPAALIQQFYGLSIVNIASGGTFAVQDGIEVGMLSLERGTHTIEVGVSNIGLLDAHNVSLKINAPEGMKIEISPKSTTIERFSVEIFTVQVTIHESVEPGNYTLVIRTKGSFARDTTYLTIYVE